MFEQAEATDPDWPRLIHHEDRYYDLDPYDLDPEGDAQQLTLVSVAWLL